MKNKTLPISSHSEEYKSWIIELKQKIRRCQIKAAIKVNTELLKLYWQMGKDINEKSLVAKWGAGFFDKLSLVLRNPAIPEKQMKILLLFANAFLIYYFLILRHKKSTVDRSPLTVALNLSS